MKVSPYGLDLFGKPIVKKAKGVVAQRFLVPPFTVLDAKAGEWQDRKRAWISMGIRSEAGRDAKVYNLGLKASAGNAWAVNDDAGSGTSVFDPVLCELMYRWFCAEGGQIVDPFAGGSVRGIVASALGLRYWGCDLREEQILANRDQAMAIDTGGPEPQWVAGDSMSTVDEAPEADFVFSCPPYGDLEVYSDDPADLSGMEWHSFKSAYAEIIRKSILRLKENRFACFVVGDFRDSRGFYRDFVSSTIAAFEAAGANLYNEAILLTPIGTAAQRVTKQFNSSRKMCKIHQNVLVFCKGDWRKATQSIESAKEE